MDVQAFVLGACLGGVIFNSFLLISVRKNQDEQAKAIQKILSKVNKNATGTGKSNN